MKKKITITILIGLGLFLGITKVFALLPNPYYPDEVSDYSREPARYEITSPVDFSVVLSEYPTPLCDGLGYWNIGVEGGENYYYDEFLPNIPSSTLTTEVVDFDLAEDYYTEVSLYCYEFATSTGGSYEWVGAIEYGTEEEPAFIVSVFPVEWLPVSPNFVEKTLDYVRAFLGSGMFPFIAMIIGIPLSFVIIRKVIALMPKK